MRFTKCLVLFAFLTSSVVALAQKVSTDYDHSADFGKYRTFSWLKQPHPTDPLMKQRIMDAVDAQLRAKGMQMVQQGGNLEIVANTATKEKHTLDTFYDGFPGGWGWRWRGGPGPEIATTTVDTYEVGTLVIDLFDNNTKQVVWRSTASGEVSSKADKNAKNLDKAVEKMFKDFPPHKPTK